MLDAAILMQWVVNVGRRTALTRLAHIFCEMGVRYGADRQAMSRYEFPVTQAQLGEASGLTAVHVNRSLKALREIGLVKWERGAVTIHDWAALAKLGQFNAAYLVADTGPERQKRLLTA
jgi:CRP-like cAMP-binding protein